MQPRRLRGDNRKNRNNIGAVTTKVSFFGKERKMNVSTVLIISLISNRSSFELVTVICSKLESLEVNDF